jgi:hypothetical protein
MIYYYASLVSKSDVFQFKKLLFRISKGKVLCKVCDDTRLHYIRPNLLHSDSSDSTP